MVTASFTTAKLLKQKGVKRPLVLTSTVGLLEELKLVGITDFITTYDESSGKQKAEYMREFNKANIEDLMEAHQDPSLSGRPTHLAESSADIKVLKSARQLHATRMRTLVSVYACAKMRMHTDACLSHAGQ